MSPELKALVLSLLISLIILAVGYALRRHIEAGKRHE